jgi:hypothetical protein
MIFSFKSRLQKEKIMGKALKRERLQDIEDINQQIQEDNYELRRLL